MGCGRSSLYESEERNKIEGIVESINKNAELKVRKILSINTIINDLLRNRDIPHSTYCRLKEVNSLLLELMKRDEV